MTSILLTLAPAERLLLLTVPLAWFVGRRGPRAARAAGASVLALAVAVALWRVATSTADLRYVSVGDAPAWIARAHAVAWRVATLGAAIAALTVSRHHRPLSLHLAVVAVATGAAALWNAALLATDVPMDVVIARAPWPMIAVALGVAVAWTGRKVTAVERLPAALLAIAAATGPQSSPVAPDVSLPHWEGPPVARPWGGCTLVWQSGDWRRDVASHGPCPDGEGVAHPPFLADLGPWLAAPSDAPATILAWPVKVPTEVHVLQRFHSPFPGADPWRTVAVPWTLWPAPDGASPGTWVQPRSTLPEGTVVTSVREALPPVARRPIAFVPAPDDHVEHLVSACAQATAQAPGVRCVLATGDPERWRTLP